MRCESEKENWWEKTEKPSAPQRQSWKRREAGSEVSGALRTKEDGGKALQVLMGKITDGLLEVMF